MWRFVFQDVERGEQHDGGTGAIVAAEAGRLVRVDDETAFADWARTDADGHGVYVGGEHASRTAHGAGKLEHEVADLPADWGAAVCIIGG